MTTRWVATLLGAAALAFASPVPAQTVLGSSAPNGSDFGAGFVGQSFTAGAAGTDYNTIRFSFLTPAGANLAAGNLYLFSTAYTGSPNGLATAGGILASATASGNVYAFAPSFTLTGGTQYFAYADTAVDSGGAVNNYAGGIEYVASSPNSGFTAVPGDDNSFRVTGVAVAPEPATWALMLFGFGIAGAALRRRSRPSAAFVDA